ncbi:alpha/beta hydrolase-fold protein [Paenibacillus motobuensis]|uniref:alpha/beta hydrolase n=1 Tax=Paenibacillus TaxID=44249 RepID=UPI00203BAFB2|nr:MULTISPECIES: alpha/beta hydrolase-fold protein [Paenibacillus]MCM3039058.1 alpha/beta hydrolase-fold protein [Paenibacillus lutimineralis]MCM3646162.1 alpha/beta hydrolase-fold protein [Paenibacillus motobuensis]
MERYQQLNVGDWKLVLHLPPSYATTGRRYPAVYVQDGGELFSGSLNYLDHLYLSGQLAEVILIGIEPHSRNDEYTPWPAAALVDRFSSFAGRGQDYVNEVADVIKPYIDNHYRTIRQAEETAIIGGSLGGLISLFAGCWRPDTFGRLGLLSASFWYEGVLDFIREHDGFEDHQRVYMSVGDKEGIYKETRQRHMVEYTKEAYHLWHDGGMGETQLKLEVEPEGTHDDLFMMRQFPESLKWLFGNPERDFPSKQMLGGKMQIPGTQVWNFHSGVADRDYRIFIAEPMSPPPVGGYAVLYTLDANATFGSLAEAARLQTRGPHGIDPVVIVGIGYHSNDPIVTQERFYDYTVLADSSELPARPDGSTWPLTGGAEAFLDFIEYELKPLIEKEFPIDLSRQSLFGHSLGGFLALYTLFTRPASFSRYFTASPSIWWKNHILLQLWETNKEHMTLRETEIELHFSVGSQEKPNMVSDANKLYQLLKTDGYGPKFVSMTEVPDEGHVSLLPSLFSPMLRRVTS